MTPVVLLILVVMWVAVLLPPYLRHRGEGRPSGSMNSFRRKLDVLERSAPGGGGHVSPYVPLAPSHVHGPQPVDGPFPEGSRHPLTQAGPRLVPLGSSVNSTPSVKLMVNGAIPEADVDAAYLLAPEPDLPRANGTLGPAVDRRDGQVPPGVLARRAARKRRRDILYTLMAACGVTLVLSFGQGGPVFMLFLVCLAALVTYAYLLVRVQKTRAEAEIKVAFLPHQNDEAEPSRLLESGGGFKPGDLLRQPAN